MKSLQKQLKKCGRNLFGNKVAQKSSEFPKNSFKLNFIQTAFDIKIVQNHKRDQSRSHLTQYKAMNFKEKFKKNPDKTFHKFQLFLKKIVLKRSQRQENFIV